jgi:four helix bundle protein
MAGHRDVIAWQRGMELAVGCYRLAAALRRNKHGSLASQLQRAAVSVPANIAEGKGRGSKREYARFLTVALGSLREVETLIEIAVRVGAVKAAKCARLLEISDETGRVTYSLRKSLLK